MTPGGSRSAPIWVNVRSSARCAAAKAVLQSIIEDKLLDNAASLGKILLEKLTNFEGLLTSLVKIK